MLELSYFEDIKCIKLMSFNCFSLNRIKRIVEFVILEFGLLFCLGVVLVVVRIRKDRMRRLL